MIRALEIPGAERVHRLDGRPVKTRKRPVARDRYATARVAVSLLFMLCAAGAAYLHFRLRPPEPYKFLLEPYLAAAFCGLWSGWAIVGLRLDRSIASAARAAISAVVAAALVFGLMGGVKAVADAYNFMRFDTVRELAVFLLDKGVSTAFAVFVSPTILPAAGLAVLIGMLGAALHRRFDTPDAAGL